MLGRVVTSRAAGRCFCVSPVEATGCPELLQARVTLTGHKSRVLDLAWLPDSPQRLVSASQDATVRVSNGTGRHATPQSGSVRRDGTGPGDGTGRDGTRRHSQGR